MTEPKKPVVRTPIYLKDYAAPFFLIPKIDLCVEIDAKNTLVHNKLSVERNPNSEKAPSIELNGENLELISVRVNDKTLTQENYQLTSEALSIPLEGESWVIEISTRIHPDQNKSLEGLYQSDDILCTQMEPQGFRKFSYGLDRPDSLSCFTTKIIANKALFPTLLSNGNLIKSETLENGFHSNTWQDPFPKPCYLFALVAADLGRIEDTFKTISGRTIQLEVYVDKGNEPRATHALASLKRAMKWDEETFGLEYDLDLYMIVAVDAFNFGAMENKGLNIFNSSAVLADAETATDTDFQRIEGIVGHEYFHNWTGNRVTLRDWFQLTLKEGLTVFRDQEFSSDMGSRSVFRIGEVNSLRNRQFSEDSGPTTHPIQPDSYLEINNFYTATVYDKGAEVIRMIHTLIGADMFRKGFDLYISENDGKAVTTQDFIKAMSEASGFDFSDFEKEWYHKSGTPKVTITWEQDQANNTLTLKLKQSINEQDTQHLIPVRVGFISTGGKELSFNENNLKETILHFSKSEESFLFENILEKCTPSLFRNFSAPVQIDARYEETDYLTLLNYDTDSFSRFSAMQAFVLKEIISLANSIKNHNELIISANLNKAFSSVIEDLEIEPAFKAQLITPPSLAYILENAPSYDPELYNEAREFLVQQLATNNHDNLINVYKDLSDSQELEQNAIAIRSLKNASLALLASIQTDENLSLINNQYFYSTNMTMRIAALSLLCDTDSKHKIKALNHFEKTYVSEPLVINKWFVVQASSKCENTLKHVKELSEHRLFDGKNPNKIRSLCGAFTANLIHFHRKDGEGYEFIANEILSVDKFNPFIASSLASSFSKFSKLDEKRKSKMSKVLNTILSEEGLSKDTYEIISKILAH